MALGMEMQDMSLNPGFDTMRGLKSLEGGGLDRAAAEAIVLFAEEATAHLATKGQVDRVRDDLTKKIDTTAKEINARIDTVSTEINARIDTVSTEINARIDTVSTEINARIDTMSTEINARIDTTTTEINARITAAEKQIAQVKEDLGKDIWIASLRERFWLGSMVIATGFAVSAYISWMLPLMLDARLPPQQQSEIHQAER